MNLVERLARAYYGIPDDAPPDHNPEHPAARAPETPYASGGLIPAPVSHPDHAGPSEGLSEAPPLDVGSAEPTDRPLPGGDVRWHAEQAEATIARVEALAERWQHTQDRKRATSDLRAALDQPTET